MTIDINDLAMSIELIKGNVTGLGWQNNEMIAELEATEAFKELSEVKLSEILTLLDNYGGVLVALKHQMQTNAGQLSNSKSSTIQHFDTLEGSSKELHQKSDRLYPIKSVEPDSDFKDALSAALGGYDIFG